MRKSILAMIMLSLVSPAPAFAAEDLRLAPNGSRTAPAVATGFGAGITLKLGNMRRKTAPRLSLTAGPSVAAGGRLRVSDFGRLGVTDGGALYASFAGRTISQETVLGASGDSERKGPSTVGWVAIAVGTVLVVGSVGLFVAARSVQDE